MPSYRLKRETDWSGWRRAARAFVLAGTPPEDLAWIVQDGAEDTALPPVEGGFTLSRALVALTSQAFQAREPERFGVLYSLIWRAHRGELDLADTGDLDLRLARRWALAARADAHRMRTLLRFMPVTSVGPAWLPGLVPTRPSGAGGERPPVRPPRANPPLHDRHAGRHGAPRRHRGWNRTSLRCRIEKPAGRRNVTGVVGYAPRNDSGGRLSRRRIAGGGGTR